ncbi:MULTISPECIES: potassium channel family protein [Mycolicibacterium]|jgi:trk system potassium uptake protein TrkA|uniref:TrkA-N domain protein n=2 Tax=Mycolicibacterium TaxID=1866885 RepID=A1T333_MYCVP|nr:MULTISPECIES: TrkA family potassium uptake protein [Mycolicibacterium]ABM11583.1 TrkA-N domain protein [Mycolicibacterium vanbaalenii PYR-1]MCV7126744.1 TrkA family potassium uptake protein [Mycolicibacterium vanbaalenii PYR-1]MDN4517581.1 TrkA family potassium uptake protein [Mycolicibacterium austroafricanum]MDW5613051.1 TrkA family potassium uptake protein [Mycolicibacterium sp. D5.8-2]PQP45578.1 TrkA family potassium uptake protein [Mycolicibacterium austroafricanum]
MRIAVAGAGAVGRSVAQELVGYGHKVLVIEKEFDRYQPATVPGAEWLWADACEIASLEEAEFQICDVAIAATGDDKANLAMALLAKTEFGIGRVVARINEASNEWLFTEAWGVDVAVSTPLAIVAAIEGAIDVGHLIRLMALGRESRGDLGQRATNVAKFTLPEDSPLVAQQVRDLAMPRDSALVTVVRGNRLIIPEPHDVLRAGDEMLFVAASGVEEHIEAMVQGTRRLE